MKELHEKIDALTAAVQRIEAKVDFSKPDGEHYNPEPLYKTDTSKPYASLVEQFGGPNRFAIRIEQDADFWSTKSDATAFKQDWPLYFDKQWREKWYGPDFVWEDLRKES